jgi:hypothetical protein
VEDTATFLGRNSDIDVGSLCKRKTTQNGIAVGSPASDLNVRKVGPMSESERITYNVDLAIAVGAFRELIHFLQEYEIGLVVSDDVDNPAGVIAPIDTADAFVDIVGKKLELHVVFSRAVAALLREIVTIDDSAR